MALTRITKGVIKPNENYDTHNINSTGIVTAVGGNFTGDLTVGGVLTYEDVTSIDSVGIITAQKDIHIGAGVSAVGVGTFSGLDISGDIDVDGHTNLDNVSIAGIITSSSDIDLISNDAQLLLEYPGRTRAHLTANYYNRLTIATNTNSDDIVFGYTQYPGDSGTFSNPPRTIFYMDMGEESFKVNKYGVGYGVTLNGSGNATFAGITTHSNGIFVPDDKSIRVGGTFDNPDFKIHSSSTYQQAVVDYNRSGTGRALRIRATNLQIENWNGLTPTVKVIGGAGAGHVELNYAGNKKFETTAQGIEVTGHSELDNVNIAGVTTIANNKELVIGTQADSQYNTIIKQIPSGSTGSLSVTTRFPRIYAHDTRIIDIDNGNNHAYFWPNQISLFASGNERLQINGSGIKVIGSADGHGIYLDNTTNRNDITAESNRPGATNTILELDAHWNNTSVAFIALATGDDTTNKSDGRLRFFTKPSGGSIAERLRIEPTGKINIGDADLTQNTDQFSVTIAAQNAVDNVARFQSSAASSGTSESLVKIYKGAGYGGVISGYITQGSDHGLKLYTANNGAMSERLRINSTGHVTKPFQPAFHARPPAAYSTPNNTDTIIGGTWSTSDSESFVRGTLANGNSIWDNSTGIFTVPVTGVYYFHLTLFLHNNTTRRDALIYRNGTSDIIARTEVMGQQGSGNRNVSVSTVVFLSANDTIRFGARNTGNTATLYTTSKPWSYACGYLVS